MKKRLLLLGYYGANNAGDEIMLYYILGKIRDTDIAITAISERPDLTSSKFGLKSVKNIPLAFEWGGIKTFLQKEYFVLLKALLRTDIIVVGGGDLIRDDKGWRTFTYTIGKIAVAMLGRAKIYLVNVGIGRPVTWYGKIILPLILKHSSKIIVRDRRSYTFCREIGLASSKAHRLIDIAVMIRDDELVAEKQPEIRRNFGSYIVVALRENANVFGQYALTENRKRMLAACLDYLTQKYDKNVVFLPFQHTKREQDKRIHDDIILLMKTKERSFSLRWTHDFHAMARVIKYSSAMIGMRLHALVLASCFGIPCLAMPYDMKIYEYCNEVGLNFILPANGLDRKKDLFSTCDAVMNWNGEYKIDASEWDKILIP